MNEFQLKRAAVIGLARAGIPAARFLLERGAKVIGFDSKTREQLSDEVLRLEREGVELRLSEHGFEGIESCDLVVLSPGLKVHFEPLRSVIERVERAGGEVIGELELASRFCPCPMIAVTGTKGKSTTVKLITEMLLACGVQAVSAGNTGTPLISVLPQLSSTSWAVVEVSSFQLEKAPTFKPNIAVLLSLLEDHQDYHPTLEQYFETKLKIFANQDDGDVAVFNVDDERVKKAWWSGEVDVLSKRGHFEDEWGFKEVYVVNSSGNESPLQPDSQTKVYFHDGWLGKHLYQKEFVPVIEQSQLPLSGQHNRANVAAALAAVGQVVQVEAHKEQIADAIRNFQTLPHRLEIVARIGGVTFVNDSQSTIPDAAIAALRAFPHPVSLLLGGRAKIGSESYRGLMRAVKEAQAKIYLFGEAAEMLEEVADRENVEKTLIYRENTLAEALQLAKMNASSGETVVLSPACASFDQFSSYEERGETFNRLAREL